MRKKIILSYYSKKIGFLFGSDVFSIDRHILYCKMCEIKIKLEKKYNISKYLKIDKHQKCQTSKWSSTKKSKAIINPSKFGKIKF